MEEYNDKSETVIFNPIKEEKKVVERVDDDEFSLSRKPPEEEEYYVKRKEKSSGISEKVLISIVAVLVVLFIAVVILAFSIMNGKKGNTPAPSKEETSGIIEEDPEDEPIEDPIAETVIFERKAFFQSGSVEKEGNIYTVRAEIYDENGNKLYEKRLSMDSSTVIKENGKELIIKRFVDIVDSLGSSKFMFDVEVDEKEYFIVSVSYRKEEIEEILNQEKEDSENTEEEGHSGEGEPETEPENSKEPEVTENPENGVIVE